jgi:hypothetical protein
MLFYSLNGFSCDCYGEYSYESEYYHCDVVLSGKVIKVFDRSKESYKVKVQINKIFKGDSISEFLVYSVHENFKIIEKGDTLIYMSDCDIYLRNGEEWLIYANQNNDGIYGLGICSATKKLNGVNKAELDFLNYHKDLVITDNTRFYPANELDNPELTSFSLRGYSLILNNLIIEDLNKKEFEIIIKIDKNGYVVNDSLNNDDYKAVIKKIKELEPFVPGTSAGEIVNSEYKMIIRRK